MTSILDAAHQYPNATQEGEPMQQWLRRINFRLDFSLRSMNDENCDAIVNEVFNFLISNQHGELLI
jgi:hypothetical protein